MNNKKLFGFLFSLVLSAPAHHATADLLSIGTTKGGAVAQIGTTISNVVSMSTPHQMRPQKMGGTQQYVDAIDLGKIEFGYANVMQYYMAASGTGLSAGEPKNNLVLVATMVPFTQGVIVSSKSEIQTIADLKGKRIPAQYGSSPLFQTFWDAFLATENLTTADYSPVPVASLPKSWEAFKEGKVDATIAAVGSAAVKEMNSVIDGGVRYISIPDTAALRDALPKTRIEITNPAKNLDGVIEPTAMHSYATVLFAHKSVSDQVVYDIVKGLHENTSALKEGGPLWDTYDATQLGQDHGLQYHPGAVKYFKEVGLQ